jgi:hypothetical protein
MAPATWPMMLAVRVRVAIALVLIAVAGLAVELRRFVRAPAADRVAPVQLKVTQEHAGGTRDAAAARPAERGRRSDRPPRERRPGSAR